MNPLSGIEAVEREAAEASEKMRRPDTVYLVGGLMLDSWAARLKAEREKIQKLLDPDPRLEVIEPYDFRATSLPLPLAWRSTLTSSASLNCERCLEAMPYLAAAMEQIRRLNLERERLEPFLKAMLEDAKNRPWGYTANHPAYRALASDGEEGT